MEHDWSEREDATGVTIKSRCKNCGICPCNVCKCRYRDCNVQLDVNNSHLVIPTTISSFDIRGRLLSREGVICKKCGAQAVWIKDIDKYIFADTCKAVIMKQAIG